MTKWYALMAALILTVGFAACSGGEEEPADLGDAIEDAGDAMEDAADDLGDAVDDAAEELDDAVDDAAEALDDAAAAVDDAVSEAKVEMASLAGDKVEVGCGMCSYSMEGVEGCELAAKIDGKPYLVTGVDFDTHASGLCTATSHAHITGEVKDGGIVASKVELTD